MNLYEYQIIARSTAIYLNTEKSRMIYPALGIIGECGEIAEKAKKLIRDDNWVMKPDRIAAITKELGDCCWYLANICHDADVSLSMIYEVRCDSIKNQIHELTFPRLVFHINRHANVLAEILERWYYDDQCNLIVRNKYPGICEHIAHIIVCIEEIANKFDYTLEEIYIANTEKLAKRKQSGTLTGEGDDRL